MPNTARWIQAALRLADPRDAARMRPHRTEPAEPALAVVRLHEQDMPVLRFPGVLIVDERDAAAPLPAVHALVVTSASDTCAAEVLAVFSVSLWTAIRSRVFHPDPCSQGR
ncbi:hypothetical protein DF268_29260 [Streptomyces sp. V2]|nr:hypothetical protein DF268_29260 [Streptomyces sp. V2]